MPHVLDSAVVSTQIQSPCWAERTSPDNWEPAELMDLLAQEVEAPLDDINIPIDFFQFTPKMETVDVNRTSMGRFSLLSEDILTGIIIPLLDYESVSNFSQTCYHARVLVSHDKILPILFKHCHKVFPVLYALRLHWLVSIKDLILELQYSKCRGCGENGTHLFLPTVQRVCANCLRYNRAFWPISLHDAKECFSLKDNDMFDIPIFRNTRTGLNPGHPIEPVLPRYLVAVKSALKLALKVHGSRTKIDILANKPAPVPGQESTTRQLVDVHFYGYLRRALLDTLPCDPTQAPAPLTHESAVAESCYERIHLQTASISFPYVPRGEEKAEKRYLCAGCGWVVGHFTVRPDHLEYMGIDPNAERSAAQRIMVGRTFISYDKDELLEHLRSCLGAGLRMWRRWVLSTHPDALSSDI